MKLGRVYWLLALGAIFSFAPASFAQQGPPHIGYIFPAGGRLGTEFQIAVGGQRLDGIANARVSGAGVGVTVVEHVKPLTQAQVTLLNARLKELREKKLASMGKSSEEDGEGAKPLLAVRPIWTSADEKLVAEISRKLASYQRKPASAAIAETVILHVVIAADAEPGERELRLGTLTGLTNPLVFHVGQLPEFAERETGGGMNETGIALPAVVNGQIMPGDVDRFRFKARKGERLVVAAAARELVPYLPDAVPGWFQATLTLHDARGNEVAFADHYRFHPDPVLFYRIPKDGEYVVQIRDSLYRGREDFVYRIAIGELPFITSTFPLGGRVGDSTSVDLKGWNLPVTSVTPAARGPGILPISVRREDLVSNRVPFAVDTLPECMEKEPNNSAEKAQVVELPIIINGHIDYPGDWDVFRFEGKAGDQIVAEVYARRLRSPLDSVLKLTDAAGKQVAFNDDHEDKGAGLMTHHADSLLSVALPATGTYYLHLGDAQRKGGAEYAYRLRISPPRADFELRVVPSSISARGGTTIPLTAYALRADGFSGDIALSLKDAPAGFVLSGAWIPGNLEQIRMTLTVPPTPMRQPLNLVMEGRAMIGGREVVHRVVPAEDMMQAFLYRHLVPAQEMKVVVSGSAGANATPKYLTAGPVKIPAGGTARIGVAMPASTGGGETQCQLSEPPEGITVQGVSAIAEGIEIIIQTDATKVKPGLKGNLIIEAFAVAPSEAGANTPKENRRRTPLMVLPAMQFEVLGK